MRLSDKLADLAPVEKRGGYSPRSRRPAPTKPPPKPRDYRRRSVGQPTNIERAVDEVFETLRQRTLKPASLAPSALASMVRDYARSKTVPERREALWGIAAWTMGNLIALYADEYGW